MCKEPLRRVHECVFGFLAFESEPVTRVCSGSYRFEVFAISFLIRTAELNPSLCTTVFESCSVLAWPMSFASISFRQSPPWLATPMACLTPGGNLLAIRLPLSRNFLLSRLFATLTKTSGVHWDSSQIGNLFHPKFRGIRSSFTLSCPELSWRGVHNPVPLFRSSAQQRKLSHFVSVPCALLCSTPGVQPTPVPHSPCSLCPL